MKTNEKQIIKLYKEFEILDLQAKVLVFGLAVGSMYIDDEIGIGETNFKIQESLFRPFSYFWKR